MIFLCQCRDKNNLSGPTRNIFSFTWGTSDQIWIENSRFHSFKYLDTVANQLAGDSLIPISFLENDKIIIRKLEPTSLEMSEIEGNTEFLITDAVFLPDTFTFATKNYIDKQFLILYSNTAASRVYELKTLDVEIPEIRPDYQPQFEIRGYSVGDIIDRDQIEVIYSDIFGSMKTEEVVISDDLNVKFTVIGNQYIEKIERSNIRNQELHSLIRAIDKIFTNDHEYEEIVNGTGEFKETVKGYYWTEKDVSIFLQKVETSFEDPEDSFWRLQYSNHIITTILQNYLEFSPDNI
ncbi:MAG: hypothetical protein KFF73_17510 [Cyclobacteriaceae bacterium]|nr:hypothetical protein [Cyclobacteriaceae bacterium]